MVAALQRPAAPRALHRADADHAGATCLMVAGSPLPRCCPSRRRRPAAAAAAAATAATRLPAPLPLPPPLLQPQPAAMIDVKVLEDEFHAAQEAVARQGDVVRSLKAQAKDGHVDRVRRGGGGVWELGDALWLGVNVQLLRGRRTYGWIQHVAAMCC